VCLPKISRHRSSPIFERWPVEIYDIDEKDRGLDRKSNRSGIATSFEIS
jgi:hypothetical protein